MPRLPKPARLRQNTERADTVLTVVRSTEAAPPVPQRGWLAATKAEWEAYWASALAQTTVPDTDLPAVTRLFSLRDERERMSRVVRRRRVVLGSTGQPRANPLYAQITAFDAEIRQLEDRLGLSPRARLQLGIVLGDAARSLADMNRDLADDRDPDSPTDLRLTIAPGPAANPRPRRRAVDGAVPGPRPG